MQIQTEKYVWKPVTVDAIRVTEENFLYVALWCQGEIIPIDGQVAGEGIDPRAHYIKVRVAKPHENKFKAFVGDWILYSDKNGYKVYTQRAFKRSFDKVES